MREIKFRAWNKITKKMTDPFDLMEMFYADKIEGLGQPFADYKFMQYTGLKDKNEKEIYEGDIVRVNRDITCIQWHINRYVFRVYGTGFIELDDDMCLEVLGNIYENPELISEVTHEN